MSVWLRLGVSAVLVLTLVSAAHAVDELYLRWDNCYGDGGTYNKAFACDTNAGEDLLVGSFRLDQTTDNVTGLALQVSIRTIEPALPSWWQCQTGGCRAGSVSVNFAPPAASAACAGPLADNLTTNAFAYVYFGPGYSQLKILRQMLAGSPGFTIPGGQEVFAFRVRIGHARTAGAPDCPGCLTPACLALSWVQLDRPPGFGHLTVYGSETPGNGSNVTWQPGAVAKTVTIFSTGQPIGADVDCQSVTPALPRTWGTIKALYR
jgi:hypothetical protein